MKVVIVTQNAPVYLAGFLDELVGLLTGDGHEVESVVVLAPYFRKTVLAEVRERFDFYGPVDFVRMLLWIASNKLLAPLPAAMRSGKCYSVLNVLRKHGLKKREVKSINAPEFVEQIKSAGVDVVLSIASPQIFKKALLTAPAKGCINYHTALLPKYRGRQPLFWALLNGEAEVGISIHEMDERLDNGPILVQERIPIDSGDSLHALYVKTTGVGPGLIAAALRKLGEADADRIANDASLATCNGFPGKKDARLFKQRGKRFF